MAASVVVIDTSNVRLRVVQSVFEEGFDSEWHTHPGPVIVQVQAEVFCAPVASNHMKGVV